MRANESACSLPFSGDRAIVYIGLGSNLGDRAAHLWEAARRLQDVPGCQVDRLSPLYETQPVGPVVQGWYLNAVAACEASLPPPDILAAVKGIEREMGRAAAERWGPRLIDLDLLIYGDINVCSEELTLPHPELWNRRFALAPLGDVLPPGDLADRVARRLWEIGESQTLRLYEPRGLSMSS